jgi:RNA polymerase sigma-70 factor (ECF subfamily)
MSDAAFEAFVRRYQDLVYGTAVRLLGNPADAEDVAQTVFLRAFQRFAQIGASPAAPGWLKTVTRNECLNHLSRYRNRWQFFGDAPETALGSADSPATQLEIDERRRELAAALARLPDHQRVPLVLFHFDEMGYQEIAATLGVSLAKVKTDIFRARDALRRYLSEADAAR